MLVQYFCCCYHLRTGAIVLAWLQLMANVIMLAGASSFIPYPPVQNWASITHTGLVILIGELFVKSITCFALIWGVIQRNHFFIQPWVFLQFIENIVITAAFLALFITGCFIPIVFAVFLPVFIIAIVDWYFWVCVKTVYNEDFQPSVDIWGEFTDTTSQQFRSSFREPAGFKRPSRLQNFNTSLPRVN